MIFEWFSLLVRQVAPLYFAQLMKIKLTDMSETKALYKPMHLPFRPTFIQANVVEWQVCLQAEGRHRGGGAG